MEFLAFFTQIFFAVWIAISQFFTFIFKLVPVWFFFWLVKKLFVWWDDIVNILLSWGSVTVLMLLIICVVAYMIMIGILHLIININSIRLLANASSQEKQDGENILLSKKLVDTYADEFFTAVKVLNSKNPWKSLISNTNYAKDNALLSIFMFQGWLLNWKQAFRKMIEKFGKWTNLILLLIFVVAFMFMLNVKQEIKTKSWTSVMIANGYDYLNHLFDSNLSPMLSKTVTKLKSNVSESITFRDKKIQMIAKAYYYTFWLWLFTNTELVETENKFDTISISTSTTTDTSQWENKNAWLWEKKWTWVNLLTPEQMKKIRQSTKDWLWPLGVYADELAHLLNNKQTDYIPSASEMQSCISSIGNSKIKSQYFTPTSLYNSTLFKNENWGIPYEKANELFSNMDSAIKKTGQVTVPRAIVERLSKRVNWVLPNEVNGKNAANIWLYFVLWERGSWYLVDTWLYNDFKTKFLAKPIKWEWKSATNISMLKNQNGLVVSFCYGYTTFKQLNTNLKVPWGLKTEQRQSNQFNMQVPVVTYWNLLPNLYSSFEKLINNAKNEKMDEFERSEVAYALMSSSDIRIRTGFTPQPIRAADALLPYFSMFEWNWTLDYMVGSLFIDQSQKIEDFIDRFIIYHPNQDSTSLEELMKSPIVQDVFGKYIWLDEGVKNFHYNLISTLKSKYTNMPNSVVFASETINKLKNKFFRGYRWEDTWSFTWNWWQVLWNSKIQDLIYSLQTEVKVNNWFTTTSNVSSDKKENKMVFFGESFDSLFWGNSDGLTYKKKGVMIGFIPLIESDIPSLNYFLIIIYILAYLILLVGFIWFTWIWQFIYNYYLFKNIKWHQEDYDLKDQAQDLLIRLFLSVFWIRLYFILTTF